MSKILAAAISLAFVSVASFAQTAPAASTPLINKRQANQEQRIQQGEASGQLTQKEANRMDKREQHVTNLENKAAADGTVTAGERSRVRAAERRTSRHIRAQKHDKQASTPAQ